MQGQVTVLVVSVDADPTGLNNELTQLGVTVLSSALHDCEELIEEKKPDLVVLLGARGAMELASLIEGHDGPSPPRMVIAADRRELAKMIGLNRDVVVSLFATESGEKVLGQRIESLARRAARRRTASIPPISLKGTMLGLPSTSRAPSKFAGAEALGKMSLKAASVPRPIVANKEEAPPPPSLVIPDPVESETAQVTVSRGSRAFEERPQLPKKTAPAQLPAAETTSPLAPAGAVVVGDAVEDGDLLSLRPSEFPDADIESVPPLTLDEAVAPPTLPPSAKLEGRPQDPALSVSTTAFDEPQPATDPPLSDFDVSSAEEALENLENLLVNASKPAALTGAERLGQGQVASGDELSAVQETPSASSSGQGTATDQLGAAPPRGEAGSDPELEAEEQFFSSAPAPALDEAPAVQPPSEVGRRAQGMGIWIPVALVAAAVGGGWYIHRSSASVAGEGRQSIAVADATPSGKAASTADTPATPPAESAQAAPVRELPSEGTSTVEPAEMPSAAVTTPDAAASAEADEVPSAGTASSAAAELGPSAPSADTSTPALTAEPEPFVVHDTHRPTCEAIVGADVPRPGRDIVHEASTLWAEARKMIVAGRLDDAHKKMCQAVSVNPESAAVEGLASFYVDQFSLEQAELWIKKAEAIRPGQRETMLLWGDVQSLRGKVAEARVTWLNALKIPESKTGQIRAMSRDYSTSAGRKLVTGDLVKAELWYRRAVVLDEQNLAALMGLANTFMRKDKPQHALAFAYKVLTISDLVPEMQVLVGNVAAKAGDQAEARRRYEKALAIRSDFFPAKRGLSELQ